MAEYKISIIVQGEDRASRPLGAVGGALGKIGVIAGGILSAQVLTGIANAVMDIGKAALDSVASYERLGMALTSLSARELVNTGQADTLAEAMGLASEHAKELQGWIQKLAIQSPFTQAGVADAFRMAMAYGFTTKESQRLTQAMIDFAAGSGASEEVMGRIALALGQIKAKGKLAGQEILQLTNAGLDVRGILAKAFNVTTEELVEMQEKGLIPANDAIEAIVSSLEHDFAGAAKAQAGTFSGLLASLKDIKEVGLREFFTGTFEAAKPLIQSVVDTLTSDKFMTGLRLAGENFGKMMEPVIEFGGQVLGFFTNLDNVMASPAVQTFRDAFQGLFDFIAINGPAIEMAVTVAFTNIANILSWLGSQIIPWLVDKIDQIGRWFVANGPLINQFITALGIAFTNIIGVVANMWQFVQPILDALIALILGIAKVVMQVFIGDWDAAWNTVKDTLNTVILFIRDALLMFVNWLLQSFAGQSLPQFLAMWQGIFNNAGAIARFIVDQIKGFLASLGASFTGLIGKVTAFIDKIKALAKALIDLVIPDWLVRHSPAPIEVAFANWLDLTKQMNLELPNLQRRLDIPAPGMGGLSNSNSYDNRREYHLHLATTQSPVVVQQSFDLMRVLDAA